MLFDNAIKVDFPEYKKYKELQYQISLYRQFLHVSITFNLITLVYFIFGR